MSTRLQVVVPDADLEEVRGAARRNGVTVSAWVRRVLRHATEHDRRFGPAVRDAAELDRHGGAATVRESRPQHPVVERDIVRCVTLEVRLWEHHLEAVCRRYNLTDWSRAVKEAVCRAAFPPMTHEEALAMEGVGWEGELDELRDNDPIEMIDEANEAS